MAHTFDPAKADRLEDPGRYRFCSRDELVDLIGAPDDGVVVDIGSGTGFHTASVAPYVGTLYGLDLQPIMHGKFAAKGLPPNVGLVTGAAEVFPFTTATLDAVYSTMTFHEFAGTGAVTDAARALAPGGRFVAVDWSARGGGETGPPRSERHDAASAAELVEAAGLAVETARERPETFVVAAVKPD